MKKNKTLRHLCLITMSLNLFLVACMYPSKYEIQEAERLNNIFPQYTFHPTGDIYLKVIILKKKVDTLELQRIYDTACLRKSESIRFKQSFRSDVPWIYLNFYDEKGNFYFNMSKEIYTTEKYEFSKREHY